MDNEVLKKRGLLIFLVVITIAIFASLVWIIATRASKGLLSLQDPTRTATALHALENCVYPVPYWKIHPERYPSQIVLGSRVYKANEIKDELSSPSQETTTQLQAQLIAVYLNILAGADQSLINATIFQAYGWIVEHPDGSQVTDTDQQAGARLYSLLEAYNLGFAGVGACQGASAYTTTETMSATATVSLSLTVTPSETPTPTITPSPSPSAMGGTIYPTWTVGYSSPTRTPTPGMPNNPTVTWTRTPTREPSDTPRIEPSDTPTMEPSITPTEEPSSSPTREPTNTIEPTVTFTLPPTVEPTSTLPPPPERNHW